MAFRQIRESALKFLAEQCHISIEEIKEALAALDNKPYKKFRRPKKKGGFRYIYAPCDELMFVQEALLRFFYRWQSSGLLFGFQPGRSSEQGAKSHLLEGKVPQWLLKLDLEDAFPSITSDILEEMFYDMLSTSFFAEHGTEKKICQECVSVLVKLTTYQGRLIQGAPTSPYLLNLVLSRTGLAEKIFAICQNRVQPFKFSIYADDFTISSAKLKIPKSKIIKTIEASGIFKINPRKISLNRIRYRAHVITGIVLTRNSYGKPKLTLPQKKLKTWRGQIYRATKILASGRLPSEEQDGMTIEQVMGYIGRIKQVCGDGLPSQIRKTVSSFKNTWEEFKKGGVI